MADFKITARHPSIIRCTKDASATHTITNNCGSTFIAGVIVEVTRGNQIINHIDADTMVEVAPGQTVTIDPTGVADAVGVGLSSREKSIDTTGVEFIVEDVSAPRRTKTKTKGE